MRLTDTLKRLRRAAGTQGSGTPDARGTPRQVITLDYPVDPQPRFGYEQPEHPELADIIRAGDSRYAALLEQFSAFDEQLARIPVAPTDASEPYWHNEWFTGLDAATLYGFLADERPTRLVEVGSGMSTRFARRAIRDHGLATTITSIDPHPRAEVDALCDLVVRQPLERVDLGVFDDLAAGDICFMDGSHRTFMNSDATVFFTEVIPRLGAGILVHVHDCFLPWDYPAEIADWFWSEHYLLACWLLAGDALEVALPNFHISTTPALHHLMDPVFDRLTWAGMPTNGTGFWFRTT